MSKKPTNKSFRKEIKGPDAFQVKAIEGMSLVEKYQNALIGAGVALVLLIIGVWGFTARESSLEKERDESLAIIEKVYNKELKASQDARKKIQDQLDALNGAQLSGAEGKVDKESIAKLSENKVKIDTLEKQLKEIKPDHKESSASFKGYFEEHMDAPQGLMAGMRYVAFLMKQGELLKAKEVLEKVIGAAPDRPIYQIHARMSLMNVEEDLKQYDKALLTADKLLSIVPEELKVKVLLSKSRILYEAKNKKEALATLETLLKEHQSSPEADRARSLKALIERG